MIGKLLFLRHFRHHSKSTQETLQVQPSHRSQHHIHLVHLPSTQLLIQVHILLCFQHIAHQLHQALAHQAASPHQRHQHFHLLASLLLIHHSSLQSRAISDPKHQLPSRQTPMNHLNWSIIFLGFCPNSCLCRYILFGAVVTLGDMMIIAATIWSAILLMTVAFFQRLSCLPFSLSF
jgi:hypothetical protein